MGILTNCPGCGRKLNVPEDARGRQIRCPACGRVFALPVESAQAPGQGPAQTAQVPSPTPEAAYGNEIYGADFDLQGVEPSLRARWMSWQPKSFSTGVAILLDIVTLGFFGLVYYGLKFGKLPKASHRDFGAGKAIGFMFIPYFNFYWIFRFWLGLCDRINLQLRLRGQEELLVPRGLALIWCVLFVCWPLCVTWVAAAVCRLILVAKIQKALNTLAAQESPRAA